MDYEYTYKGKKADGTTHVVKTQGYNAVPSVEELTAIQPSIMTKFSVAGCEPMEALRASQQPVKIEPIVKKPKKTTP